MQITKTKKTRPRATPDQREGHKPGSTAVAALLDSTRAILLELSGGTACVATMQEHGARLEIVCRRPLSSAQVEKVHRQTLHQALQFGLDVAAAATVPVFFNGRPYLGEDRPGQSAQLCHLGTFPLCMDGVVKGVVEVSTLEPVPDVRRAPIFEKVVAQAPAAVAALSWYLASQRNLLQQALLNVTDGVVLCDAEGRLLFLNERACHLVGAEGDHCSCLTFDDPGFASVREVMAAARRQRLHIFNRVIRGGKDSSRLLGIRVQLLRDQCSSDGWWQATIHDLTKRWQAEQLASTLAIASHELQTPLLSVKNTLELLLEQEVGALNGRQKHCLLMIDEDIGRLRRLLAELLDIARFDGSGNDALERRRFVRLDMLIKRAVELYRPSAEKQGLELRLHLPASLSNFPGDRDRIMQLLVNLVDNAIKFTPSGGEIVIGAEDQESTVLGWVRDTGVGIDPADASVIFERFRQLDNLPAGAPRGHGLGLSIAREIVELHHGRIWVESALGQGSTFYFSVPKS